MIDFKELPTDGVKFEQLIREILVREGFDTHWTGVGPDGGRDLVIIEKFAGPLSTYNRKWLISCKHFAHSGNSVGREQAGSIVEDTKAIGAEGYILVCSTQPSTSLISRLEEISKNQGIITKFWDSIEIEKRLLNPRTFSLIHTFFPESAKNYQWKIYNAFSPAFWAANYKSYFFYLSSRHSTTFPYLDGIEAIVKIFEKIKVFKDTNEFGWMDQSLRLRAVYYDDKHCTHTVFLDYIYPHNAEKASIIDPVTLYEKLGKAFTKKEHKVINRPDWDVRYVAAHTGSDTFQLDHKNYYEPFMKNFESGSARNEFLHDLAFQLRQLRPK